LITLTENWPPWNPKLPLLSNLRKAMAATLAGAGGAGDGAYGPQLEMDLVKPVSIDTITVIEDAYALEAYPDSTGEGVADMQIGRDDAGNARQGNLPEIPVRWQRIPGWKSNPGFKRSFI
jgi:hypothetical protein